MKFDMKLPSCRLCGIGLMVAKFLLILVSLYFFICSLSFLSDSFRLLGGKNIGGSKLLKTRIEILQAISSFYILF